MFKFKTAASLAVLTVCSGLAFAQGNPPMPTAPAAPAAAPAANVQLNPMVNQKFGYAIGVPAGWGLATGGNVDYYFGVIDGSSDAFCNAAGSDHAPSKSMSVDQIKKEMSQDFGPQFWDSNFFGDLPNHQYLGTGAVTDHPGGMPVQMAIVEGDVKLENGQTSRATFVGMVAFKPGVSYAVVCGVSSSKFESVKPHFGAVLSSFKILGL